MPNTFCHLIWETPLPFCSDKTPLYRGVGWCVPIPASVYFYSTHSMKPWPRVGPYMICTFCWVGRLLLPHHGFWMSGHVWRSLLCRRHVWVVRVVVRTEAWVLGLERLKLLGRLNPVGKGTQHTGVSPLLGVTAASQAPRNSLSK